MAVDAFLKIDGIDGESANDRHKGEIEVLSWSWGISSAAGASEGGGRPARASAKDLQFSHAYDRASPLLARAAVAGQTIKQAWLTMRKPGGAQAEFLKVTMTNVRVGGMDPSWDGHEDVPIESVSLRSQEISFEYTPMDRAGQRQAAVVFDWDMARDRVK